VRAGVSHDRKAGPGRQVARLAARAAQAGQPAARVEAEAGSGVNGARSKVRRLLAGPRVRAVAVEHRGRLGRVNTELVVAALPAHGRRPARNRAEKALRCAARDAGPASPGVTG
jgi:putative resolvase